MMHAPAFYVAAALLAFLFTALSEYFLVPALRRLHLAQPILEIGPSWHLSKAGTPTLGGLGFIAGIGASALCCGVFLFFRRENSALNAVSLLYLFAVLSGGIGFFDDYCKLRKKENKGLSAWQKYLLQLLAAALFLFLARALSLVDTGVRLPVSGKILQLGIFYYPLALLYITGIENAFNLTDGVDGLLSSLTGVLAVFLILLGVRGAGADVAFCGALLLGAMLGFLIFNLHPAKVFMGDTGSLFLGGMVSAAGILTGEAILLLFAGGVMVIETASVVLQVVYFKFSKGKRLFRMAPLHHHFEKCGWSEERVVAVFSFAALGFAALALVLR